MSVDKPAATVHDAGSGEALDDINVCGKHTVTFSKQECCYICHLDKNREVPTPPASPTVTVDRETALRYADAVIAELGRCIPPYQHLSRTLIADALLRAAERQK